MNILLWILQIILGIYFTLIGVMHFIVPDGLPAPMAWMYDLSPTLHYISGTAEILGGLGLILPSANSNQNMAYTAGRFGSHHCYDTCHNLPSSTWRDDEHRF